MRVLGVYLLSILALTAVSHGQTAPPPADVGQLEQTKVLTSLGKQLMLGADGKMWLLINFNIAKGWHLYWKNPGASGKPPTVSVTLSDGWTKGELLFPRPSVLHSDDGIQYGYEESLVLLQQVIPPPTSGPTSGSSTPNIGDGASGRQSNAGPLPALTARVALTWLVCKDVCRAGSIELAATFDPPSPGGYGLLESYPVPIPQSCARIENRDGDLSLRISQPQAAAGKITFVPEVCPGIEFIGTEPFVMPVLAGSAQLNLPFTADRSNALGGQLSVRGLVLMGSGRDESAFFVDLPVPIGSIGQN